MSYRLLAGMAALCVTVLLGSARGDLVLYHEWHADSLHHRLKPNSDSVRDVALSPDGKTLVVAGRGGFFLYDADTGKRLDDLAGKTDYGTGAAFASDGKSLFTADADGNLLRWDMAKRTIAFRFPQVHATIARIILSHDGSTLASTDGTHTAIWDARTGKLLHAWSPPPVQHHGWSYKYGGRMWAPGDSEEIAPRTIRHHLALAPDGRSWVGGRTAQQFKLCAVGADADSIKHAWPEDTVASIDIAPDSKSYAVSTRGNRIEIVAAESLRPILGMKSTCADCFVRYSPDGKTLVGYQPDFGVLSAIDPATGNVRWRRQQAPAWRTTAVAIVGKTLATGDSDRRVRLYDLATGKPFRTIDLPAEPTRKGAVVQPIVLDYPTVEIYLREQAATPTTSPHVRHRLGSAHLWYPTTLTLGAFLNDGNELLVMPHGQTPIVYDTRTGKPARHLQALRDFLGESHGLEHAEMSRDRRRIFMTSGNRLYVWDMLKQRIEHDYEFPARLIAVAVAPDGKRFAVAGSAEFRCPQPIYVGSVDDAQVHSFQGHEATIARLAFSADGKRLFSASLQNRLQVNQALSVEEIPGLIIEWDIAEAKMVRSHQHAMCFIGCTSDGSVWALQEANRVICQLFDWREQKVVGQIESRAIPSPSHGTEPHWQPVASSKS